MEDETRHARARPTPSPAPGQCPWHSGLYERVRDLEGRADSASAERRQIVRDVTELKVSIARWMGGLAAVIVVVQIGTAVMLRVLG